MKDKKLTIVKNTYLNDSLKNILSFSEVKSWLKSSNIFKHLFKYNQVELITYNFNTLSKPFLNCLLLKILCKGKCIIKDEFGNTIHINTPKFLSLFKDYLIDKIYEPSLINKIKKEINSLKKETIKNKINFSLSSAYLRTDLDFALKSGGSIGHIAGVLNNLEKHTNNPVFITSDFIPTVKDSIKQNIIHPEKDFSNLNVELWSLNFNNIFEKTSLNVLKDNPPCFIYQRYNINNYTGIKLSKKYNVPFILEYNGSEIWIRRNWGDPLKYEKISEEIELLNLKCANLIVVVSKPMKDELIQRGIDANKILVNPNGVDIDKYSPEIDDSEIREKYELQHKNVIGFIGTFGKWHGAEILVESFGKLLNSYPEYKENTKLLMIGDGVTMPLAKKYIKKYNIEDNCILTGNIPQAQGPKHLAACDILASPHVPNTDGTPFFGSPTKLFEYMAMGKGIVASDLDQIGEVLEHNKTAFMTEPGNSDSFMNGLKTLLDNSELRKTLGMNARNEAQNNYTWAEHVNKIIEKLKELTNETQEKSLIHN